MKPMLLAAAASLSLLGTLAACSSAAPPVDAVPMAQSTKPRAQPIVPAPDAQALQAGNTAFAADLYQTLRSEPAAQGKNLFFSPHSISLALAMTYAGARGNTATQMASALHYTLPQAQLHPAFNALDQALMSRGKTAKAPNGVPFRLNVANSVWGAPQTHFVPAFLDTLAESYGAGIRLTDFARDPEAARKSINAWVAGQTADKIQELLTQGTIDQGTRMVLVNAIYFNAAWQTPFDAKATQAGTFHGANGDVPAQLMSEVVEAPYAEGEGWQAVSLPYDGNELSFVAILPSDLAKFEAGFTGEQANQIASSLSTAGVTLKLPKFKIPGASFSLKTALEARGMTDAFSSDLADYSGMADKERLFLTDVVHQAFVSVDEKGTEAAAATAVIAAGTAAPSKQVTLTLDKPFLFFVRDDATGAVLFLGRVLSV
jgi:serpin B